MNTTVEYVATPYWLTTLANSCSGRTCARARWRPPVEAEEPVARHGRAPALGRGGEGCKVPPVSTHTLIGVCRVCCNQTAYLQGAKKNRAPVPLWNPVCMRACCAPKVLPMPKVLPPPTPGSCSAGRRCPPGTPPWVSKDGAVGHGSVRGCWPVQVAMASWLQPALGSGR